MLIHGRLVSLMVHLSSFVLATISFWDFGVKCYRISTDNLPKSVDLMSQDLLPQDLFSLERQLTLTMEYRNFNMVHTPESYPIHPSDILVPIPQRHLESMMRASNGNTMFNVSAQIPNNHVANSGALHHQYQCYLSAADSRQSMPYPAQQVPYCFDQHVNGASVMVWPHTENICVAFKRKNPPAHLVDHNNYGYSSFGSSPTFPVPPNNNFQVNLLPDCGLPQHSTIISAGEQYQRNVRSRQSHSFHNPAWPFSSSNPPHQFYSGYASYMMNQSVLGNGGACGTRDTNGAYRSDQSRNLYSLLPTSHGPAIRGTMAGPSRYNQRQISNRNSSSYTQMGVSTSAIQNAAPPGASSVALPRYSRRPRNPDELQPLYNVENPNVRWIFQDSATVDVPPLFDTLDLVDEHRDLRLDIDDMSYEELLALEERIGNVNNGLSADQVFLCLTERVYCSSATSQDDQEDASCPVCLEEYTDKDNLGIMKCLHVFHISCIKDWLRMRNACPVCKAPALADTLKQKQHVSS